MNRNQFLTRQGFLSQDGRLLCRLAAQPGCDRAKLRAAFRRRGYDDFSINCVFREADDRRLLIQKANQARGAAGASGTPAAPGPSAIVCDTGRGERHVGPVGNPPSVLDTVVGDLTVEEPLPGSGTANDPAWREALYLAAIPYLTGVADRPGDQSRRLTFADWLDARGLRREAAGQRWAARHGKRPEAAGGDYDFACGGWYAEWDRAPDAAKLPDCLYRIAGAPANSAMLCYESYFLWACGAIEWGADGEPIGP
jgi:uncharacterized protein (TIGR02996 family)